MGMTYIEAEVMNSTLAQQKVSFLVDSGAGYSLLPYEVWHALDLRPTRDVTVALADGTKLTRAVSECRFRVEGIEGSSPVILGEEGDEALLGAVTLENLGLVLNPYKRTLQPMQIRL